MLARVLQSSHIPDVVGYNAQQLNVAPGGAGFRVPIIFHLRAPELSTSDPIESRKPATFDIVPARGHACAYFIESSAGNFTVEFEGSRDLITFNPFLTLVAGGGGAQIIQSQVTAGAPLYYHPAPFLRIVVTNDDAGNQDFEIEIAMIPPHRER